VPTFLTPHPQNDPQRREKFQPGTPSALADDAPFAERLGALGGRFTLSELADFLLAPLHEQFHCEPVQAQFSVYTVARFNKDADLAQKAVGAQLGPLLSGLAQVEEPTHAGAGEGMVDVPHQLLNARHWAAVGFLGAAHIVADQDPPHAFDEQRIPIVRDKYFIPYLVALLQRLILARADAEAAATVRSLDRDQADFAEKLRSLREELLNFAVSGDFHVVSSREAVNRFYVLARQGLRVPEALSAVRRALADLDSARQVQQQMTLARGLDANVRTLTQIQTQLDHNIHTVASVQIKVEWLEVFFVSFYAAELSHMIAELFGFDHHYTAVATLAWAVGGGMLALFSLKLWQHGGERKARLHRVIVTVVLVSALVIGWFVFGLTSRPMISDDTSVAPARHEEQPVSKPSEQP
jgi:hypothetical protein